MTLASLTAAGRLALDAARAGAELLADALTRGALTRARGDRDEHAADAAHHRRAHGVIAETLERERGARYRANATLLSDAEQRFRTAHDQRVDAERLFGESEDRCAALLAELHLIDHDLGGAATAVIHADGTVRDRVHRALNHRELLARAALDTLAVVLNRFRTNYSNPDERSNAAFVSGDTYDAWCSALDNLTRGVVDDVPDAPDRVAELVFSALGGASMCWSDTPTGTFAANRAKRIGDDLIAALRPFIRSTGGAPAATSGADWTDVDLRTARDQSAQWHREVAALVGLDPDTTTDDDLLHALRSWSNVGLADDEGVTITRDVADDGTVTHTVTPGVTFGFPVPAPDAQRAAKPRICGALPTGGLWKTPYPCRKTVGHNAVGEGDYHVDMFGRTW